jgi:hypothetical protein
VGTLSDYYNIYQGLSTIFFMVNFYFHTYGDMKLCAMGLIEPRRKADCVYPLLAL